MMAYILVATVVFLLILIWLILEYGILIPPRKGLSILMYHKVSEGKVDGISISAEKLKRQFVNYESSKI